MEKVKEFLSKINYHFVILGAIVIIAAIVFVRLNDWNNRALIVDPDELNSTEFDREALDAFVTYTYDAEPKAPEDMVIACFGNAPFADDRYANDNLAALIAEKTGSTVYNFAFEDSYLSCMNPTLQDGHIDLFSLYWLTTIFALDNDIIVDRYLEKHPNTNIDIRSTLSLLQNIDFNTVDVITIMYDGSDYLAGRGMYNKDDSTNIRHFGGALEASIDLIKATFPHIQIIVLSPTYAYGLDEDGNHVDSTLQTYGEGPLGSYVQFQAQVCYTSYVSFVDTFYGAVSVEEAPDLLEDHIHLKPEARELLAEDFMRAFNFYLKGRNGQ